MTRIIQISDTHMSGVKPHFVGNWAPLRDWIAQQAPDLVIHTGDVTVDGAGLEADFGFCTARLAEIGPPVLSVPGNHDVGLPGAPDQPTTGERLARWDRHFGADRWLRDIPGWRLLGLDAMLFGSGKARDAEQHAWAEAAMASASGRRIAWFMHQPLFLEDPEEADTGYWSVKPAAREGLMRLVRRHQVALVATGHLHRAHDMSLDGTRYIWCPASSFVVGEAMQPAMPGTKQLGAVSYVFDEDGVAVSTVIMDQLTKHWIDDVVHEVYPKPAT